jgi:hypothetical protein
VNGNRATKSELIGMLIYIKLFKDFGECTFSYMHKFTGMNIMTCCSDNCRSG